MGEKVIMAVSDRSVGCGSIAGERALYRVQSKAGSARRLQRVSICRGLRARRRETANERRTWNVPAFDMVLRRKLVYSGALPGGFGFFEWDLRSRHDRRAVARRPSRDPGP